MLTDPVERPPHQVILVGNGPSLLHKDYGQFIDSHPVVVRFNHFTLAPFERHTGLRTDVWAVHEGWLRTDWPDSWRVYWKQSFQRPHTVVFCPWDKDGYQIYEATRAMPFPEATEMRSEAEARRLQGKHWMPGHWPSTGILAIQHFMPCDLVGFDHFQAPSHHYFTESDLPCGHHQGDTEQKIVEGWIQSGQVVRY